jgi:hypothetical protein
MHMRIAIRVTASALLVACVGCGESDLRGSWRRSRDGNTYLAVTDDNGGHCGGIFLDGKPWKHPIGEPALVEPGRHTIQCGGSIGFDVPAGTVYKFDYWGP